jgi:8-oxo-dGTP pyrophosphatase MutT (NUDIX family)
MSINLVSLGNIILNYYPLSSAEIPSSHSHIPLTFVLVIAKLEGRYVWQFNPERNQWEIPGGGIEPNEAPDATAVRELMEEASQTAKNLQCKGFFTIQLASDKRLELGLLYTGDLESLAPLVQNNEADRLHLWDLTEDMEGNVSDLSYQMFDLVLRDTPYQLE